MPSSVGLLIQFIWTRFFSSAVINAISFLFSKTILGDFHKEQDKWCTSNKAKASKAEAAVAPWVGYNDEDNLKAQIMALSLVCFIHTYLSCLATCLLEAWLGTWSENVYEFVNN